MPNPILRLLVFLFALLLIGVAARSSPTDASPTDGSGVLAIVNGRVLTQSEAGEFEGAVLVRDGRIEAVGPEVEVPESADRIDASGLTIVPGFIDARSVLWLPPESRQDGGNDGSLNILDGVDPYAEDWPEVLRSGVTTVAVQPGNSGLLGGRGAVLRVAPGQTVEDLVIAPDAFVQAALGVGRSSGNSVLRRRQFDRIKRVLAGVKRYKEEWEKFEDARKEFEAALKKYEEEQEQADAEEPDRDKPTRDGPEEDKPNDSTSDSPNPSTLVEENDEDGESDADDEPSETDDDSEKKASGPPKPPEEPERDEVKEFLGRLLEGEVPLRIEAHREDDVRNALELADEFGLSLILEGLSAPGSAREELENRRMPMILGPILESGRRPVYRRDRGRTWPADLLAEDSRWAMGSYGDRPADSVRLRAHASAAVARGVPRDRVLRALTSGAAEVLGIADQVGSIAEGLQADLVAFAGDPLDLTAPIALVVAGGEVVYHEPEARAVVQRREADPPVSVVDVELPDRLPRRFVIKTRRLLGPDGRFSPGGLSVADGAIVSVGATVEESDGVPVYDVGDARLTPGLLTAFSTLGQDRALAESSVADAGFLRAVDAYDPSSRLVRSLMRGGVLRAHFSPAPMNVIAGAVGAVRLGATEPVVNPEVGLDFVLSGSSRLPDRFPASLSGQLALVRSFLGLGLERSPTVPQQLDYYLSGSVIDRLKEIRRARGERIRAGECEAFFEVDQRVEVEAALSLAEELQSCAVLVGPGAIDGRADRLASLAEGPGLVLVLRPLPPGPEASRRLSSVVQAAEAGALVLFSADDAEELRLLAASAVAAGLPRSDALRALALGWPFGASETDGPWEVGSPADFVLWDGSPIDLSSRPLLVVVDGRIVP